MAELPGNLVPAPHSRCARLILLGSFCILTFLAADLRSFDFCPLHRLKRVPGTGKVRCLFWSYFWRILASFAGYFAPRKGGKNKLNDWEHSWKEKLQRQGNLWEICQSPVMWVSFPGENQLPQVCWCHVTQPFSNGPLTSSGGKYSMYQIMH